MAKNSTFQVQETAEPQEKEDDDEEEAISLCDFILHSEEQDEDRDRRTSSDPSDFFEFFNDLCTSEMCHAEDIIFCGKLVAYKEQPVLFDDTLNDSSRRYCESLMDQLLTPNKTRTNSSTKIMRSCRSLDYNKSCRDPSLAVKPEGSYVPLRFRLKKPVKLEVWKPRWYGIMFGVVKSPPEMDLRDMKNRQGRRNSGGISRPALEGRGRIPSNQRNSWSDDFLNVLSCKNDASVATMAASSPSLVP